MFLIEVLRLIRVKQYYKNFLVFAALFFSLNIFEFDLVLLTIFGFISLCLVSSAGYIINDIFDLKKDSLNPEKKKRPLVAKTISVPFALALSMILYLIGFFLAYLLNMYFFLTVLLLAVMTFLYTIYFKNIVFADIIFISVNFVLRAMSGVYLIGVELGAWFLIEILFFSFFLVASKIHGDLFHLSKNSQKYKPVLAFYSKEMLEQIISMFLGAILIIYGLYAYFSNYQELLFLYPLLIYILLRYYYLMFTGHTSIKNPEEFVFKNRDWHLIPSFMIFAAGAFVIYYII